jgi:hypothetical protein
MEKKTKLKLARCEKCFCIIHKLKIVGDVLMYTKAHRLQAY